MEERVTLNGIGSTQATMYRVAVDSFRYIWAKLVPTLTGLLFAFVFTRALSPGDYGTYSLIVAVVSPLLVLLSEWAAQATARFYSEFRVSQRLHIYVELLRRLIFAVGGLALLAGAVFVLLGQELWGISVAVAAASWLVLESVVHVIVPVLPANFDVHAYRKYEVGKSILRLVCALLLVWMATPKIEFLFWGNVTGTLIMLVPLVYRVRFHLSVGLPNRNEKAQRHAVETQLRRFLSYGLPMIGWQLSSQFLSIGDRYIIGAFLGNEAVGVYSATYNAVSGLSGLLSAPVSLAVFPIITRLWAEGRKDEARSVISEITGWYLLLGLGLIGGIGLVAREMLSLLLGPAFRAGWATAIPIVAGIVVWNASILGHKSLELAERTGVMLVIAATSAMFNLVANLVVVPLYGIAGAAWTTFLSYGLYTCLIFLVSCHSTIPWKLPWKSVVVFAVASAACSVGANTIRLDGVVGLVAKGLFYTAAYLGICYIYLRLKRSMI